MKSIDPSPLEALEEDMAESICILERVFPPRILCCNVAPSYSSCAATRHLWTSAHMLDVPHGAILEDIERICQAASAAEGIHGTRVCDGRSLGVLHIIV
jgi:hypothetical protein